MPRTTVKRLALGLLGLTLTLIPFAGPASAQTTGDRTGTGTDTGMSTTQADRDGDGFDLGWLGLLGLAGLAGLLPRKTHTVATHRTGEMAAR